MGSEADLDAALAADLAQYRSQGFAAEVGCGRRPAVVVVDFIRAFTEVGSPLSSDLEAELAATGELLAGARAAAVPIVFTTTAYAPDMTDAGLFVAKVPSLRGLVEGTAAVELDPRLGRRAGETLLVKKYASAFFGTALAATLTALAVDTVFLAGCTTSGCIRATAVDALQSGFRAIVPRQCVGDRAAGPHRANLLDIHAKYGDVVELEEALAHLRRLEAENGTAGESS